MLVFATSMSPVAGWLGGWVAGVSIRWLRRPTARPCSCHAPLTPPHSNWPLFPLPSLHADQDEDLQPLLLFSMQPLFVWPVAHMSPWYQPRKGSFFTIIQNDYIIVASPPPPREINLTSPYLHLLMYQLLVSNLY